MGGTSLPTENGGTSDHAAYESEEDLPSQQTASRWNRKADNPGNDKKARLAKSKKILRRFLSEHSPRDRNSHQSSDNYPQDDDKDVLVGSSDELTGHQVPVSGFPTPGDTVDEVLQQLRRIEFVEYAKWGFAPSLQDPLKKQMHMLLLHIERLRPLICRRLEAPLLENLQAFYVMLWEHTNERPVGKMPKQPRKATTAQLILYMSQIRAILGVKRDIKLYQRHSFLDWCVGNWRAELQEERPPNGEIAEARSLGYSRPDEDGETYLFEIPWGQVDCLTDSKAVRMVRDLSELHARAFKRIYGIEVEEVGYAEHVPDLMRVLNLRAILQLDLALFHEEDYCVISNAIGTVMAGWKRIVDDSISDKYQERMTRLISGLCEIEIDRYLNY